MKDFFDRHKEKQEIFRRLCAKDTVAFFDICRSQGILEESDGNEKDRKTMKKAFIAMEKNKKFNIIDSLV